MEIKSILVPTDGSEHAEKAMAMAVEIAGNHGASVKAIYVVDRTLGFATPDASECEIVNDAAKADAEKAFTPLRNIAAEAGVPYSDEILAGKAAETIVKEADSHDLLVMSTIGKTGLTKALMGSVSQRVIGLCNIPVLVTKVR